MSLKSFLDEDDEPQGINFVDFSQIVLSTVLQLYKPGDEIKLETVREIVLNCLRFNVLKQKAKYPRIVICVDNGQGGYWRRHKYYFYKKNRDKQKAKTEMDWETIYGHMNTVAQEFAENLPYMVLNLPHTEADDIIGVMCRHIHETAPNTPILITSSDGDFTQAQKYKNVKQYSPTMKKMITPKHGHWRKDLLTKVVKGDPKDTVSNIKMPVDFLYAKLDGERQKSISAKLMVEVFEASDPKSLFTGDELKRYNENLELVDFDYIPKEISDIIINAFDNTPVAPRRKLYPYFVKNRLVKMIEVLNDF